LEVESNIPKLRPMVQRAEILSKHTVQVDRTLIYIKQGGVICKIEIEALIFVAMSLTTAALKQILEEHLNSYT